jgi:predicted RNase H-like nuclease (RuvC/YqgF family)
VAVQAALEELSEQKAATADAFGEAREARKVAFSQPEFTFSSKKTQKFIDRWRDAADEVIEKADFLFAYAEKKQAAIRNSDLSTRAASGIEQRKSSFATAAKATDQVIRSLERTLEEGDDLISALEIAGVLGTLSSEVRELQGMHDRAVASLPELEALVREGEKLVDDEFSALGV